MTVKKLVAFSMTSVQEPELERPPGGVEKARTSLTVCKPLSNSGGVHAPTLRQSAADTEHTGERSRQHSVWEQLRAQLDLAEQSLKAHHESVQVLLEQHFGPAPPRRRRTQTGFDLGQRALLLPTASAQKELSTNMRAGPPIVEDPPEIPSPEGRPGARLPEPELPLPGQPAAAPPGGPAELKAPDPPDLRTQKLVLLPIWAKRQKHCGQGAGSETEVVQPMQMMDDEVEPHTFRTEGRLRHLILHPMRTFRMSWDIFSLFLVLYDLIMIPMGFFDLPRDDPYLKGLEWVTRVFWTLDIPISFLSGYIGSDGVIEMRPARILKRYLRTWFILDALVVSVDWAEHLLSATDSQGMEVAQMGKASRPFRIIRMVRLLRLARMNEIVHLLMERLPSDLLVVLGDILKLIFAMLSLGHLVACLWWAVGEASDSESWIISAGWDQRMLGEQYIMSFRWALSQFAGGMDEVIPQSLSEHLYAAGVFVLAFWSGTVFLSILTSHMTQLFIMGGQQTQQLSVLRRYLALHGVSRGLAMRAQRNAQHVMNAQQRTMSEQAVGLMDLVSEALLIELHYEIYSPVLGMHPFFNDYMQVCPHVVRKICHAALDMSANSQGDVIFHHGETAIGMILVKSGVVRYSWGGSKDRETQEVQEHGYISEAALWVRWVHRGVLTVAEDSIIIQVNAESFQSIVSQFEQMSFDPSEYAAWFVDQLNASEEEVTDLPHLDAQGLPPNLSRHSKAITIWKKQSRVRKSLRFEDVLREAAETQEAERELERNGRTSPISLHSNFGVEGEDASRRPSATSGVHFISEQAREEDKDLISLEKLEETGNESMKVQDFDEEEV
mmetsp:Transcript_19935/g.56178  ORF Transcript_19935/g.56178 Transcript_19935/m.56178 type:complete len:837 (+) Transcript_19935:198-2708(+)